MSLNGLNSEEVGAAHTKAIAEPAGWFLLKYATRAEVELLGSGAGGFSEAREAIARYEEESPLFGLVVYKKKKALLKYVPDGTSRLLQARLAVHVQSVIEKFPHDALISLATAVELTEPVLANSLAILKSSGSVRSHATKSQRHLTEILEDSDDESDRKKSGEEEHALEEIEEPQPAAEPVFSPTSRTFSPDSDNAPPRGSQDTEASHTSVKQELERDVPADEISTYEHRPSGTLTRSQTLDSESSWGYKPKQKLGPRPSLDAGERSRASGSFSKNVSTLPAGIRIGPKSPGFTPKSPGFGPKSPGFERPRTGSSMRSFSSDTGRFGAIPSARADPASSRNSVIEIPEVPAIPVDYGRFGVAPSPRADRSVSRSSPSGVDSVETPEAPSPELPIDPSIPPEKLRLMKAMNQRKKNKMTRKASVDAQALQEQQTQPVQHPTVPPTKFLQRKGSSLKIDSSLPSVQEHHIGAPLQTPSPKTYAPSPKHAPSPKSYASVPPSPRSIPDTTVLNIGYGQPGYAASGRPRVTAPRYGEEVHAWASRIQTGARPAFNFPRSNFNRTSSAPRSAASSRSGSLPRSHSFTRNGSHHQKGSFARTHSAGVERGSLRKRKPTLNLEYLSDVESSEGEVEPPEALFGAEPEETKTPAESRSSNATSSMSSEPPRGRVPTKGPLDAAAVDTALVTSIMRQSDRTPSEQTPKQASILENESEFDGNTSLQRSDDHPDEQKPDPFAGERSIEEASEAATHNAVVDADDRIPDASIEDPIEDAIEEPLQEVTEASSTGNLAESAPSGSSERAESPAAQLSPEDVEPQLQNLPEKDAPSLIEEQAEEVINSSSTDLSEIPVLAPAEESHAAVDVPTATETAADVVEPSHKAATRSVSTTKSQGESEANAELGSPATELSTTTATDDDELVTKPSESADIEYSSTPPVASDDENLLLRIPEPKHQSISTIASDDTQLTTKPSHLRLDTSKHSSSEVASVDGDALFEELKTATVEQATPMLVPRSPGAYAFPIEVRPVSRDAAQLIHISASSSAANSSPDKSHPGTSSASADGREIHPSSDNAPIKLSIQKARLVEGVRRTPSVSSNASRDGATSPSGRKISGVSKLISARIQAFEKGGSSSSTKQSASTSVITPSIVSRRKASLSTPPGSSGIDGSNAGSRPSSRAYPTPSPSPHSNLMPRPSMFRRQSSDSRVQSESASVASTSVRGTFLRTESSSSKKSSKTTSPIVETTGSYFSPRKEKKGSISSVSSSVVESIREGLASPSRTSLGSRRGSRKSSDTVRASSDVASPMSPASESGRSSDGGDSSSVKKGSKRSRLLRRMSSIALSPRRSIARQTIDESHEPENRKWIATVVGDVNIQFPDTLLWKRRHMQIDSHGYIVLEPAKADKSSKVAVKQYHISGFRAPYMPDQDREELPYSIILDFMDSSTLQCACQSSTAQAKLLQVLSHAYRSFTKQR